MLTVAAGLLADFAPAIVVGVVPQLQDSISNAESQGRHTFPTCTFGAPESASPYVAMYQSNLGFY